MTSFRTLRLFITSLSVLFLLGTDTVTVQAGCVPAHAARAIIKKYKLKTVSQIRRRVPGQMLSVQLCGSGSSATYKVKYKTSGRSGNTIAVKRISAR